MMRFVDFCTGCPVNDSDITGKNLHNLPTNISNNITTHYGWLKNIKFNDSVFRAIPIFVVAGAGLECLMIFWRPFGVNFYEVYKRKEAKKIAANKLNEELR